MIKLTIEGFIERAKSIHGEKYDYTNAVYKSSRDKIEIVCPSHGTFYQIAQNHLSGKGCTKCATERNSRKAVKRSSENFIERSNLVHGGKYCYLKTEYIKNNEKVIITCPEHGDFEQQPSNHLSGHGCPFCAGVAKSNTKLFIEKANELHKNKYDYSKTNYVSARVTIIITCPSHGDFLQMPNDHLCGKGCVRCGQSSSGFGVSGHHGTMLPSNLYVLSINNEFLKIGLSKCVKNRICSMKSKNDFKIIELHSIEGRAYSLYILEQTLINYSGIERFEPKVKFDGHTECFPLGEYDNIMNIIDLWLYHNKGGV